MALHRLLLGLLISCGVASSWAESMQVAGIGKAPLGKDLLASRTTALQQAKRDALINAIKKLHGAGSVNDPKIQQALDRLLVQLGDDLIADQSASKEGDQYVLRISVNFDELQLRQWMDAENLLQTTARNFPILVVMDEYFTTPTDKNAPLKELVEYSHDGSYSYSAMDKEASIQSRSATRTQAVSAHEDQDAAVVADDGSATMAGRKKKTRKTAAVSDETANDDAAYARDNSVKEEQKNIVSFKRLVEYQPKNVNPEDNGGYTYAALADQMQKFDIKLMDNKLFRSQYFTGKALTLKELENSPELARYVQFAHKNKADFFMAGTATILQGPVDAATGKYTCTGGVKITAYSTSDAEVLASNARSEAAYGDNPDDCHAQVARKLGTFAANRLSSAVHDYWRKREVYGREYTIKLFSLKLDDDSKDDFADILEGLEGVAGKMRVRQSGEQIYEVSITYKGDGDFARDLRRALKERFPSISREEKGSEILYCLEGKCPKL